LYLASSVDHARLGMTASAKRVRTAVNRNRIRRVIRESFRLVAAQFPRLDIVVIVKEAAREADNPAIFASLARHWSELERRTGRSPATTP
jgi:ribonuclease P protein component